MVERLLEEYIENLKQEVEANWETNMFFMNKYHKNTRSSKAKIAYEQASVRWYCNQKHLKKLEIIFNSELM